MAFGTGHHATTEMMISAMLKLHFKDKKVLDFGCGTAILAILAEKLGANHIFANDVEEPAFENSILNSEINNCSKIKIELGGIEVVPDEKFGIILANVNTNAILENSKFMVEKLSPNGYILFSGILNSDRETIAKMARILNVEILTIKEKNNWLLFLCKKLE
jgi:ribosomal protein L11 methyltransferase